MLRRDTLIALVAGVAIGGAAVAWLRPAHPVVTAPVAPPVTEGVAACELTDREVLDRCNLLVAPALFANRFLGVKALQHPLDAWVTLELIAEQRPDVIVDVGTHEGGSAALWATMLEQVNPDGRVISIDIEDLVTSAAELPVVQERVEFLIGSSTDAAIVAEVKRRVGDAKALVILDSLHTREHVLAELEAYSELIAVGGYIVVQDTVADRYDPRVLADVGYSTAAIESFERWAADHPALGVFRLTRSAGAGAGGAVAAFLATHSDFAIDKSRERYHLTNNWNGYLRRVR